MTDPCKILQPQDEIAVTMTRQEWAEVTFWLDYGVNYSKCKKAEWANACVDKKRAAEQAAMFDAAATRAAAVFAKIEAALEGPPAEEVTP